MSEVKNYSKVAEIAGKHLGQVGGAGYKDTYDPSLLVAIPRTLNREAYGIEDSNLPFTGVDVWNAYEVSAITEKGLPVSGLLKIMCPADTEFHVESKSIKLYLNSFNMTPIGKDTKECIQVIESRVSKDLSELLKGEITCKMFTNLKDSMAMGMEDFTDLGEIINLDEIEFTSYKSDASQLETEGWADTGTVVKVSSNLLRSNCRVTNQPDWGDIYIHIEGPQVPSAESLAKYIVSHRQVSHFHEEIVEMTFTHLMEAFEPEKLMVAALYTRRGGIDINPIRATDKDMIPLVFTEPKIRLSKTLRQ